MSPAVNVPPLLDWAASATGIVPLPSKKPVGGTPTGTGDRDPGGIAGTSTVALPTVPKRIKLVSGGLKPLLGFHVGGPPDPGAKLRLASTKFRVPLEVSNGLMVAGKSVSGSARPGVKKIPPKSGATRV